MISVLDSSLKILNYGYFFGKSNLNKNDSGVRNLQMSDDYENESH
jgi:hypothetical protein